MPVKKPKIPPAGRKTVVGRQKALSLTVPAYSLDGNKVGTLSLPKEIFQAKVNEKLLAQAVRVYLTNQKSHFSHTKTRGEVKGSGRKIWSQKGTGRARHGSITAPIFVGGGIALGPKSRKVVLDLPKKMKRQALISALSAKIPEGEVLGITGLDKVKGKVKQMRVFLQKIGKDDVLMVIGEKNKQASLASRNLPSLNVSTADQLNPLLVVSYQTLLISDEAVKKLSQRLVLKEGK